MLQLILGPAGSGKTGRLLAGLSAGALAGGRAILLVPEQFSAEAEAMVYRALGDAGSAFVEVLSFRTLAERILESCGGAALPVMTDAGRAVFVRRALDGLADRLTFARHRRDAAFCGLCADTINELKTAGAAPDDLLAVGEEAGDGKLVELAAVFAGYEALIADAAMDPADRLVAAADRAKPEYFAGKICFIDNFDGFTAPEYRLLEPVLRHCEATYAALCCDGLQETDGGLGLFSPVRKTAQSLIGLARRAGRTVKAPEVLSACNRQGDIASVAALLEGREAEASDGLSLTPASDEWEEVRLVAAEMRRLALAGVPYSKMAFVCRDTAPYEGPVRRLLALFGIPLFVDTPDTVEYTAPVAFVRAALALLTQGLSTEPALALLKTGLTEFSTEDVSALENYCFTWRPTAAEWRAPFEKNPEGLLAQESEVGKALLATAEGLRAALVPKLEGFLSRARVPAGKLSRELYLLMEHLGAPAALEATVAALETASRSAEAQRLTRAWDLCMNLLDQMSSMLARESLSAQEYDALLLILIRSTDFGDAPQTLEAVTFAAADRMRLAAPSHVFVAGLAEGEFPRQVGYSGLLTHEDRERLVAKGIEMPGSFENRIMLEDMFLYRALTAPSEALYMSWPARLAGQPRVMSAALEPVEHGLRPSPLAPSRELLAATSRAAFDRLCEVYREDTPEGASLWRALEEEKSPLLAMIAAADNAGAYTVARGGPLAKLVGKSLTLSATRAEAYYACPFSYYMERVLRVRPRRRADLSSLESGTFVHYVLEQVLRGAGAGFATLADEALDELCAKNVDAFVAENLPGLDRRATRRLERLRAAVTGLLRYMRDAAAQSDFAVDALELPLDGGPEGAAPLEVETADGRTIRVTGKIDRVDVLERDGRSYLSIVDYKTGRRSFDLDGVYCGIGMQMMIYMDALCKNQDLYENPVPAAVLYLRGDPDPRSGKRGEQAPLYSVDGLLLDDEQVLRAMERDGQGLFIPVRYNRDGTLRGGNKKLASLEKMGAIAAHVERLLGQMAEEVYAGAFPARPTVKGNERPCAYCPYRAVCRHEDGRGERTIQAPEGAFDGPGESALQGGEPHA